MYTVQKPFIANSEDILKHLIQAIETEINHYKPHKYFLMWQLPRSPFKNELVKSLEQKVDAIQKTEDTVSQKIQSIIQVIDELSASNIRQAIDNCLSNAGTLGEAFSRIRKEITSLTRQHRALLETTIIADFKMTDEAEHARALDTYRQYSALRLADDRDIYRAARDSSL